MNNFNLLESHTSTENPSHDEITAMMIKILKNFHVYWNSLRINGELGRAKVETKNLMLKLLQDYHIKESFLFEIAKTLVTKIKLAYKNFITAHQTMKIMKHSAPDLIQNELLRRYESAMNAIKFKTQQRSQFIHEIAQILYL